MPILLGKIYKEVKKINKGMVVKRSTSPYIEVAAIHSTLLSLVVAIVSAYLFISFINLKELEREVLEEAEKINNVHLVQSFYQPAKDEFPPVDNNSVLWDLSVTYSHYLLMKHYSPEPLKLDSGAYEIPKDPADRVEKFFKLLWYINNRYPFPHGGNMELKENQVLFHPDAMHFQDIEEVEKWIDDLNHHLYVLEAFIKPIRLIPDNFNISNLFDMLYKKHKKNINREALYFIEGNPTKLFNNFIAFKSKAENVFVKTFHQLERYKKYKTNAFSIRILLLIYFWGMFSFFLGILWPIYGKKYNYLISNIVPISFYITIIIIAGYKMFSFF